MLISNFLKVPTQINKEDNKMANVRIRVKNVADYKEIQPKHNGKPMAVTFGIRLYESDELRKLRDEYMALVNSDTRDQLLAKFTQLEETGDRTLDEFYTERNRLKAAIDEDVETSREKVMKFYRRHFLYITKAHVEVEDDEGNVTTIAVEDSRTAKPVESLWSTPDECLSILLDTYLAIPAIKDSLLGQLLDTILDTGVIQEEQVKN